jgi:TRAP-type mannitol/chloroaromatic compound transport system substrate-binding protein
MLVAVPDFSMYWFYAPFHKIKVESLQKENSMKTSAEEILQRAKEKNAKLLPFQMPSNKSLKQLNYHNFLLRLRRNYFHFQIPYKLHPQSPAHLYPR